MRIITSCSKVLGLMLAVGILLQLATMDAFAGPTYAPEKMEAVMIGDRLVDVSLALGVIPQAMAVRASLWEKGVELRLATDILGCPLYASKRKPKAISDYMTKHGLKLLILEKSPHFCLYKKNVNPANMADLVKDVPNVRVEYVDFSKGVGSAVRQVAKIVGKERKGEDLAQKYEERRNKIQNASLNKKVLILRGLDMASGKYFVQVEAPGGYSDKYMLSRLGCTNVGGKLISEKMKVSKGFATKRRFRDLDKANPDVIVITGDAAAVQRMLAKALKENPSLAQVPAIKNGAMVSLPMYVDSSVLEYPEVFREWKNGLSM
ncbi:hypothetical protein D0S45_18625 [Marinifilum sp. JC120]|nr:hypothetical protein D0S45_18625 [Marinifilum sp. JC120]